MAKADTRESKKSNCQEILFFTGLNRKIMEEKCNFSFFFFLIDYFHSKAGKGEDYSLNKGL